jgi:perosamine synthetase
MNWDGVPLSNPDISQDEIDAVMAVLRTGRLSMGPRIEAFEAACAALAGRKYGIGVNSGTSGLHLCVKACDIGPEDEVITTPFSFVATTNCILYENATPVFVDIDPKSYNMNPSAIEAAITPKTKAIIPVEVFGNPAHFEEYERIAQKHHLILIEDCCEAIGSVLNGRPAGNFGDCGVFAFYPNKQITVGEGGMIVTDDEKIRDLCRSYRNQGRAIKKSSGYARMGYNYRLDELSAALGEAQMKRLDTLLERRRKIAGLYDQKLSALVEEGLIHLPPMLDRSTASWFVYVIRFADQFSGEDRDAIIEGLLEQGVQCSRYFEAIHTLPYIQKLLGTRAEDFPLCTAIADRTVALPFSPDLSESQVSRVVHTLENLLRSRKNA